MALTDKTVRSARFSGKLRKLSDEKGLYLLVNAIGKYWRFDYRFEGKRKTISLGVYPATSLKGARAKLEAMRKLLNAGVDPSKHRKAGKASLMERALRAALERKELFIEYQPQAELSSCRIVGAEALLRWQHPEQGLISPAQFIPLAEETGLIIPIGEWVLHTACAQNKAWLDAGLQPIRISVNLSALQFRQKDMVNLVRKTLAATDLPPEYLELEITEGMLIHDAETVIAVVRDLHAMGVHLALDDFGTGYSSLSYLKRFRVHRLKIDQSFVRDITIDPDDAAISAAVISLGHALNMTVIAEGVETSEQNTFLAALGCDEVQGYYFGRPMAAADFTDLLAVGVVTGIES